MIDNNELEIEAMCLFKKGATKDAQRLQNRFLDEVKSSGEDHCSCPEGCKHHGHCVDCVIIHRGHSDHLPYCMQAMLNKRIEAISELTEHSFKAPQNVSE